MNEARKAQGPLTRALCLAGIAVDAVARSQAALSQYPALKGLLMRSARGEMSTSLSVGIFSVSTRFLARDLLLLLLLASFARSAWPFCAERATEKNRNT